MLIISDALLYSTVAFGKDLLDGMRLRENIEVRLIVFTHWTVDLY